MKNKLSIAENLTIVIPAKDEEKSIAQLLRVLIDTYPDVEVIVVDDGSTDNTAKMASELGVRLVQNPYSKGNGAAIKAGARAATKDYILFMDADGQHRPEDIHSLFSKCQEDNYDMVVGARSNESQANLGRMLGNRLYNKLASWIVGRKIKDLTSGFRLVRRKMFIEFLSLLPNGFSYPTTSTMAFFRAGYSVAYVPIHAKNREGKSHINLVKDGLRFLLIIFKVGTLYSPLKIFFPVSMGFLFLGLGYYGYTYSVDGRFTNMSALLFITSLVVFMIGLVSEQITMLMYKNMSGD